MPYAIIAIAVLAVVCAGLLCYLVACRAPLREEWAEVDDHPHPEIPEQRASVEMSVAYYEGETPLSERIAG